jgi:hypothetical protein
MEPPEPPNHQSPETELAEQKALHDPYNLGVHTSPQDDQPEPSSPAQDDIGGPEV